jgi:hypothetical protein
MREVPGTWEIGDPGAPMQIALDPRIERATYASAGGPEFFRSFKQFTLGECNILVARERVDRLGDESDWLWHLSISHPERHPTWDEIKAARYRLLSNGLCFGILLPPPEQYVNVPAQDHVFHLWEITDPREPWGDS